MFPLWEVAIAPVLTASRARRVVEIGALRGENTVQLLDALGPECELHVIDPKPAFDPAEHEARFGGRYVFHEATSHAVLPTLGAVDVALIDGDHNWFTVYHELKMLADAAAAEAKALPVMVMHDVGWPYGRRDLYYDPTDVPDEHRQPYRAAGMRPGRRDLMEKGGLNPTMFNAELEGGPRNGVMTALDDFVAEHPEPLRIVVLPVYFGLAIVAEERVLAANPELAAALDRIESVEGKQRLLEVIEQIRLRGMIFQHNVFFQRDQKAERAASRYLSVVKAALLNEHHLEHEVRLRHLAERLVQGRPADVELLRDPPRAGRAAFEQLKRERRDGTEVTGRGIASYLPYTAVGRRRLDELEAALEQVRAEEVPGDLVEVGTGRGGGAIFLRAFLEAHELADRRVFVADRFRAAPEGARSVDLRRDKVDGLRSDLNQVRDGFERFELLDDRVRFLQGPPAATLPDAPIEQVALLRIGPGTSADDCRVALDELYGALSIGATVMVDAAADAAVVEVVRSFRADRGIEGPLEALEPPTLTWRKGADEPVGRTPAELVVGAPRAPLAPPAPADAVDLSVVVVFYDMAREAPRTLRSLSRSYQEGLDDVTYEVIAVDNGSPAEGRITEDLVRSFGPEFRFLDLGDAATPSPVTALNAGIAASRGRNVALMIDGAHVLTPGVLRHGLLGLDAYGPAIVATQQWYVGPGQQSEAMDAGYDQAAEDRLFEAIAWPDAGYRLFEIGHFVGDRDWFDGMWESNCIFVPRAQLEQVGGYDESFAIAGGGYGNLDLYERLGAGAGTTVVSIIGEGSFHQCHGGTTTNQPDQVERRRRVFSYSEEFAELRGRRFRGPGKPIHYVGRITTDAARRTKPRRLSAKRFAVPEGHGDGFPTERRPVPEELRDAFVEAVWHDLPWRDTTWLDQPIDVAPTDLFAYQEAFVRSGAEVVVETGAGLPGRTAYLASICDLLGRGEVITVGVEPPAERYEHPRVRHVEGPPHDDATAEAVRALVGERPALVVIGTRTDTYKVGREFGHYSPLVAPGSYVIVERTVVNGHPVWTAFGPGPTEAVKSILTLNGDFVADADLERYSLSLNPNGYLRRVR
ncbi:MAG TPA: CmcI family methyltransferase [Aquihabitans sp.]|nr:CmcI family methyltransferase [Aquihabitans sp.]